MEMLFLSPDFFGKGLGKQLINFVIKEMQVNKVDVNEQNNSAVAFYKKLGFETYERTENDNQGKNYPILKMKLIDPKEKARTVNMVTTSSGAGRLGDHL